MVFLGGVVVPDERGTPVAFLASYLVFGVLCLVFGVWCLVFGVLCLVFGVWCLVLGFRV